MKQTVIQNAKIVNEGKIVETDLLIEDDKIVKIGTFDFSKEAKVIDGTGKFLLPGVIDGQVHFRDPGLTHKADLTTESRAAIAGGVTSFMDMPNTNPNVLTLELWEEKNKLASEKSLANYGFFMGVNADNIDDLVDMDTTQFFAVSDDGLYFSKEGNLLADNPDVLEKLFSNANCIVAVHSEKEGIIKANEKEYQSEFGNEIPFKHHPDIRNEQACVQATKELMELAEKHGARLHILHLTTLAEAELFRNDIPLEEKKMTTEVCVQHLWFSEEDYERLGAKIKWNPAIKSKKDKEGLFQELLNDKIDLITTDHAPHTVEEKSGDYFNAKSGGPMVQHSLNIMLEFYKQGKISLEKIVDKMCHNPAILYDIKERGYIRENYKADLVLVDMEKEWTVDKENILYKCGWSPMEGETFSSQITHTFVNGNLVYENGRFNEEVKGEQLEKEIKTK